MISLIDQDSWIAIVMFTFLKLYILAYILKRKPHLFLQIHRRDIFIVHLTWNMVFEYFKVGKYIFILLEVKSMHVLGFS